MNDITDAEFSDNSISAVVDGESMILVYSEEAFDGSPYPVSGWVIAGDSDRHVIPSDMIESWSDYNGDLGDHLTDSGIADYRIEIMEEERRTAAEEAKAVRRKARLARIARKERLLRNYENLTGIDLSDTKITIPHLVKKINQEHSRRTLESMAKFLKNL